ncbi:MAG: hypothetical protein K2J83_00125 [Clostridia bacterium]|nr:hypothetical protein [Clostridia bacterium]
MEGISKFQSAPSSAEKPAPEQEKPAPPPETEQPQKPNPMVAVLERHEQISNRLKQNGEK